jgi:hypothetical protein
MSVLRLAALWLSSMMKVPMARLRRIHFESG